MSTAIVEQTQLLQSRMYRSNHDVKRVSNAFYVANLVAIVGRNIQFDDREPGNNELNNNFCIEMETIGIAFECFASRARD